LKTPEYYVKFLGMQPHPEGGWYKETYRSQGSISSSALKEFEGDRSFATGIYFLLTKENFSAFHRIKSDEMWHFYDGDGLTVHEIRPNGNYIQHKLGLDLENGYRPQLVIPAKSWFASEVKDGGNWCLVGCTVSPGFDFQDFELAQRDSLIQEYPPLTKIITRLTRT
jgi:predicted cupin superfamily sugar epimerase